MSVKIVINQYSKNTDKYNGTDDLMRCFLVHSTMSIDYKNIMNAKLTFIIPTIGRPSLKDAVGSVLSQTCQEWKIIIVFDGIEPNIDIIDDRITIITKPSDNETKIHKAGSVRNYAIPFAATEWVAFLDDDDIIKPEYVEVFLKDIANYDNDLIIYRMIEFRKDQGIVLTHPFLNANNFYLSNVGISFVAKKAIFDAGIFFQNGVEEDYYLLDTVRQNKYKMMISPEILYLVRHFNCQISSITGSRVFINHPPRV